MDMIMTHRSQLQYGYWPALSLDNKRSVIIQSPSELQDQQMLELACTQTSLPATQQKKLVSEWCSLLPSLSVTHILFRSRVSQALFDAAAANPDIKGLFVKWGPVTCLDSLEAHPSLEAVYFGSYPGHEQLQVFRTIPNLRYLFLSDVTGPFQVNKLGALSQLKEFGVAAKRGKTVSIPDVNCLREFLALQVLWVVGTTLRPAELASLSTLPDLVSVRTSWHEESQEVMKMRESLPNLKYWKSVFH